MSHSTVHVEGVDLGVLNSAPAGSQEWLATRRRGLGASEVPAVLGLSKYQTAHGLWMEKRGLVPIDTTDSPQATVGRFLEDPIAQMFAARHPHYDVVRVDAVKHPTLPFLFASGDRALFHRTGNDEAALRPAALLEIKNRGGMPKGWGDSGSVDVPEDIFVQTAVQSSCYIIPSVYVGALLSGNDMRDYPLLHEPAVVEELETFLAEWWDLHVVRGVEPPIQGKGASDYIKKKFAFHTDEWLQDASEATAALLRQRIELKDHISALEDTLEDVENQLKAIIGNHLGLIVPETGKVSWKKDADGKTVEWKKVLEELPSVLEPEVLVKVLSVVQTHTKPKIGARKFLVTSFLPKE